VALSKFRRLGIAHLFRSSSCLEEKVGSAPPTRCRNKLVNGTPYINIGSEQCCLFVRLSRFLVKRLDAYPLLYYAVEEALECAKIGYYSSGIMVLAQLFTLFNEEVPDERHLVAHEILRHRPSHAAFEQLRKQLDTLAAAASDRELAKLDPDKHVEYHEQLLRDWNALMQRLHPPAGS
jgi:hypothetical protein